MTESIPGKQKSIAVLYSGGVDSTVLVGWLLEHAHSVQPIYIRGGLFWESAELAAAQQVLEKLRARYGRRLKHLETLEMPVEDLYGDHWSTTGCGVPDAHTEDAAVFLPGRNPLLLLKACLWCVNSGICQLALGTLSRNPFPDATGDFFDAFEQMLLHATGAKLRILRPFANLAKQELLTLGRLLPLEQTFSCLAPVEGAHCGACNKCAERQQALSSMCHADASSQSSVINCRLPVG